MIKAVLYGFKDCLDPKIRPFIFWPIMINFLVFFLLFGVSSYYFWGWMLQTPPPEETVSWFAKIWGQIWYAIKYVLSIIVLLFNFILFGFISTLTANFIGSPFNGILSEKLQKELKNTEFSDIPLRKIIKNSLLRELGKFFYYLPRLLGIGVGCLVLSFIPPLNLLTPFLFFVFTAWILALQYLDYPADNNQESIKQLIFKMRKNRFKILTFGSIVALLSAIPFVNFIIMPACVLAATRVYLELK